MTHLSRGRVLIAFSIISLGASCSVPSSHPVAQGPTQVDAAPYLGAWNLVEIGGDALGAPVLLTVTNSGSELTISAADETGVLINTLELTEISGAVIASIENESGLWSIVRVRIEDAGNRLVVEVVDEDVAAADIGSGAIGGSVKPWDSDDRVVRFTASPQELRDYISGRPGLFEENSMVLLRP